MFNCRWTESAMRWPCARLCPSSQWSGIGTDTGGLASWIAAGWMGGGAKEGEGIEPGGKKWRELQLNNVLYKLLCFKISESNVVMGSKHRNCANCLSLFKVLATFLRWAHLQRQQKSTTFRSLFLEQWLLALSKMLCFIWPGRMSSIWVSCVMRLAALRRHR